MKIVPLEESRERLPNVQFLNRVEEGREVVRLISFAHQYADAYHDCTTEEQIEEAQAFLSEVADILDIYSMLKIQPRFGI